MIAFLFLINFLAINIIEPKEIYSLYLHIKSFANKNSNHKKITVTNSNFLKVKVTKTHNLYIHISLYIYFLNLPFFMTFRATPVASVTVAVSSVVNVSVAFNKLIFSFPFLCLFLPVEIPHTFPELDFYVKLQFILPF